MKSKIVDLPGLFILAVLLCACAANVPIYPTPSPTAGFDVPVSVTETPATETPPAPPVSENDKCGNQYYPVVNGAQWTYRITVQQADPTTANHAMSVADDGKFMVTVQDGESTFALEGICSDDGIILLDVPGVSASYSSEDGSSTLSTTNVEGVTVPDDIQVGDDWSQTISVVGSSGSEVTLSASIETTYKALGYETVAVPAGTFYALKVEQNGSMIITGSPAFETHGFIWYVQGVGMVKSGLDGTYTAELAFYNIP